MECIVTARRRPRPAARQNSESTDLSRRVHKIGDLLQAPAEGKSTTPAVIQTTPGPIPSPNPSNHPAISKSPTFIYHPDGQAVETLGSSNLSPTVLDEPNIEDEGSSVYTAEAVRLYYLS